MHFIFLKHTKTYAIKSRSLFTVKYEQEPTRYLQLYLQWKVKANVIISYCDKYSKIWVYFDIYLML